MPSRRTFLNTLGATLGASAIAPRWLMAQDEIKTALKAPVGLQLWSVREYLPKDLPGTLAKVRALGFREVEGAGLWGRTVEEMRAALDTAGLRCSSAHMGFDRLRDDLPGALAEAKAMGATSVVCPWITHKGTFGHEDILKAIEVFNRCGKAAAQQGLRFGYHPHGYEFVPAPDGKGTLFEILANSTDPKLVTFQVDVFHAFHGGTDPARLIDRYAGRVHSLHLKDLKKGLPVKAGTAVGRPEEDVPVGAGQIDMPAVLRSAIKAGVSAYYIEDESADPWAHIPESIAYLKGFSTGSAAQAEAGFAPLFNGKDLSGWVYGRRAGGAENKTGKGYQIADGVLFTTKDDGGNLFTEKEYADFVLRFEFKLTENANNGVGIRAPLEGDAAYTGIEIQVLDDGGSQYTNLRPAQYHGSIYHMFPAKRGSQKPVGEWNSEEITVKGRQITVVLNGTTITQGNLDDVKDEDLLARHRDLNKPEGSRGIANTKGHIGLLGHGARVEFRNIRVKEL